MIFVGQAPGKAGGPPLEGRVGAVLEDLLGGPLSAHERVNLLPVWPGKSRSGKGDAFPPDAAVLAASRLQARLRRGDRLVLLGLGVARAFGLPARFLDVWILGRDVRGLVLPHPSGINLWWNSASNREDARAALRVFSEL